MAEKSQTGATTPGQALAKVLQECETVTDLFKLANSDAFKRDAAALPPDDLTALRQVYREKQTALDGKVKLEPFDGQVLNIVGCEWWHSDTWDNDGVTLHFRPERDASRKYKALTSSAAVVRFCNRFGSELPTEEKPTRVIMHLVPVKDAERAAKGQRQWTIKVLPAPQATPSGSPF